ncbi:MAG: DUF3175 domain-containing protein [Polyangiales bacterium]
MARRALHRRFGKSMWSGKVRTHYHTPEGLFTRSAEAIASTLKSGASNTAQAIRRLSFYINRAGHNLSSGAKKKLHQAMRILEGK